MPTAERCRTLLSQGREALRHSIKWPSPACQPEPMGELSSGVASIVTLLGV